MEKFVATNSETSDFRNCVLRWFFVYVCLLRPKMESKALYMGSAYHDGLSHGFREWMKLVRDDVPPKDLEEHVSSVSSGAARVSLQDRTETIAQRFPAGSFEESELWAAFDELAPVLEWMVRFYWRETREDFAIRYPVLVERPFEIPVRNKVGKRTRLHHAGVIDLVMFDQMWGTLVLNEHKTSKDSPLGFERRLEFDPQCGGYLYALRELLLDGRIVDPKKGMLFSPRTQIGTVVYNVMKRKIPTRPSVNKDGSVSTRAIDTLPEHFENALNEQEIENGISPSPKQRAILEKLRGKGSSSYFMRYEHSRPDRTVERWRQEQYVTARQMRAVRRDPKLATRNDRSCNMASSPPCPYRSLCIEDSEELRSMNFRIADDAHEEVVEAQKGQETWLDQ
jgi:hypothetical protein